MSNEHEEDFALTTDDIIEARISHVLTIWPKLNMSMLQVGIGTALSPKMWHPVFNRMIEEGKISRREFVGKGPTGRDQSFTIISLIDRTESTEVTTNE